MSSTLTPTGDLSITNIGALSLSAAEIAAFDPGSKRLYVTSDSGLTVVDLSNPAMPSVIGQINLTDTAYGAISTDATSVAISHGVLAVAVLNTGNKAGNGQVLFLDAATGELLGKVDAGVHPDSVTFTPDGTKLLVANEGEYLDDGTPGGKGSVSIIDISGGPAAATVQTAGFTAFDGQEDALRAAGVRIFNGNSVSDDVEPEYIAISPDGTKAMVTLQEANAVGLLDITTGTFTSIVPLGTKDFTDLLADFGDRDGPGGDELAQLVTGKPVHGLYMPDAIASYTSGGQTYYVMANEGDDRDDFLEDGETVRLGDDDYDLDDTTFPNEEALKENAELGRLTVSNAPGVNGDTDGDGDIDQIQMYGARSFSIRDSEGNMVYDSADLLERIVLEQFPELFFDGRSDNKGPEPEGITLGEIGGKIYAFVALERSNMTLVFDVTEPTNVTYAGAAQKEGDIAPEGALFISAEDSPTGKALYIASNEGDDGDGAGISVFEVEAAEQPQNFTLQLLHFSDAEAGLLASDTAPNLAALVDAFDDDFANTLILSGGDNYIPGPFLNAGTDLSVQAVHGRGSNLGAADIEILNRIGVQASAIGNHEFDLGTREFRDNVVDAAFPYLSANLDFSGDGETAGYYTETVGVNGLEEASSLAGRLAPSTVVTYGAEKIGIVGATTQILESISSTGGVEVKGFDGDGSETNDMAQLAALLQPVIDDLRAQGVNKIILTSHLQQLALEKELAGLLDGVDIILAAGSHTRAGDAEDEPGSFPGHSPDFVEAYPMLAQGADGGNTLIVVTDNEYTYLGRLVVEFDAGGNIITDSLDPSVSGAYATTAENVAEAWGVGVEDLDDTAFTEGTKGAEVKEITNAVQAVINAKDGQIWGYTDVYLEGERNQVRNQETNFGSLTADANLFAADEALKESTLIISLKNGGGIRAQIGSTDPQTGEKIPPVANPGAGKPEGAISQLDIENALRFNNKLMVFDTTVVGLRTILEHGFAALGNQGRFPQFGGVAVSYDPDLPAGSRIVSMALIDEDGDVIARLVENGQVLGNVPEKISVVTLSFLANGGDGYPVKANAENFRFLMADGTLSEALDETIDYSQIASDAVPLGVPAEIWNAAMGEQQALQDYLQANHGTPEAAYSTRETPAAEDERIQDLNMRAEDTVLDGETMAGTESPDRFDGTAGDDDLSGALRNDRLRGFDGDDLLDGGKGADKLLGGDGDDVLQGGRGDDFLKGQAGNDALQGGRGDDQLIGGEGDDLLLGSLGRDSLKGSDGDDTLVGGIGGDTLRGGAGDDIFLFAAPEESGRTEGRRDVIADFVRGEDRIQLDFDAQPNTPEMDDFTFITGAFAPREPGRIRTEELDGGDVLVQVNAEGGPVPEMTILVHGVGTLDASDFILSA